MKNVFRVIPPAKFLALFSLIFASLFCAATRASTRIPQKQDAKNETVSADAVSLAAVGDILLDRGPGKLIAQRGADFVFAGVVKELRGADIAFGNLECAVSAREPKVKKLVAFRAAPRSTQALKSGGFDIVSLANNHALDCGARGLAETMRILDDTKISFCGVKNSREKSPHIAVLRRGKLRIAFVAFCEFAPQALPENASPNISRARNDEIESALREARKQSDVAIAAFHFGREYSQVPDERQRFLARLAVQSGADLVLGSHPHVTQGMQFLPRSAADKNRRPALVAYSLGNFLFDSSPAFGAATRRSLILRCVLDARGVKSARVSPIQIEGFRPRAATPNEARVIMARQIELCRALGTRLDIRGTLLKNEKTQHAAP